ncbi:hypothetical protein EV426DRAFT_701335 [Tirmania nivea]|nr:hypothetical protein EV426DRAFT_701335 [Tirmania nivea]
MPRYEDGGVGHRSHRDHGGHKSHKDKDRGEGHKSHKDKDRRNSHGHKSHGEGGQKDRGDDEGKSHYHHRRESGGERKQRAESSRGHSAPGPHSAQSGPESNERHTGPRHSAPQERVPVYTPGDPVGPHLGYAYFPGFGSLRYPMRTDPSAIKRDPETFEDEVVPLFKTCQYYRTLISKLRQLTDVGWIEKEHPIFKWHGDRRYYYLQGDGLALQNMITEVEKALSQADGIGVEALEFLFQDFTNRLSVDLKEPPHSPASYSGLIRLAMELTDIQQWILPTQALQELGWDLLEKLLNQRVWQPTFYKYFPTKYAGINLEGYESVQTFPVPFTQYWSPKKWSCLREDLTGRTTERLKFETDYRSVIAFVNEEYGVTFLPILSRFFTGDRAFFANLDKFKKHTIKHYRDKPEVPSYSRLVDRLKNSKSEYLVKSNQPEEGDDITVDLVGLVAFAYSLIDLERVIQETMAGITRVRGYIPQTDINVRPPAEVAVAIGEIVWQPAKKHVERNLKVLDEAKREAKVLKKLNNLKLEAGKLIGDTPEGRARAAALTMEQEVERDQAKEALEAQKRRERAQRSKKA